MPSIITASQLRTVLGVSSSLYSDAYLEEIINTAEGVLLPLLVSNSNAIKAYELKDNVAKFYTQTPNYFVKGQSIVVTGLPAPFTATHTVVEAPNEYLFTAALTNADVSYRNSIPAGTATLSGYSAAAIYASSPRVESAVYVVAIEVFQSRTAAGGQIEGVDFQPTPFKMGRSLLNRCIGLLGELLDVEALAQ
jgi:hypothetical protein